jgi:uracil-DNA glycosylase
MKQNNKALEELVEEIKALPENQSYTERGVPPIFQFHEESKILLVGRLPAGRWRNPASPSTTFPESA